MRLKKKLCVANKEKAKSLSNLCPVVSSCLLFALSTWRLIDAKLSIKTNTTDTKKLRTPKGRIKCSYLHPRLRLNCCLKRKRIRISTSLIRKKYSVESKKEKNLGKVSDNDFVQVYLLP